MTNTNKCYEQFVFIKKTPFMQRIQQLVASGHTHYVMGMIPVDKASNLVAKFDERYAIGASRMAASRARRAGEGSARLLMYLPAEQSQIQWVLLRTASLQTDNSEQWRDALFDKTRIEITGYQLVRRVRPVTTKEKAGIEGLTAALNNQDLPEDQRAKVRKSLARLTEGKDRLAWTWTYKRDQYHALRDAVQLAIRQKNTERLNQLIHSIARTPGFGGAREQVHQIWKFIHAEWVRSMPRELQPPELPKVGYVRRLPDQGLPLSQLILNLGQKMKKIK